MDQLFGDFPQQKPAANNNVPTLAPPPTTRNTNAPRNDMNMFSQTASQGTSLFSGLTPTQQQTFNQQAMWQSSTPQFQQTSNPAQSRSRPAALPEDLFGSSSTPQAQVQPQAQPQAQVGASWQTSMTTPQQQPQQQMPYSTQQPQFSQNSQQFPQNNQQFMQGQQFPQSSSQFSQGQGFSQQGSLFGQMQTVQQIQPLQSMQPMQPMQPQNTQPARPMQPMQPTQPLQSMQPMQPMQAQHIPTSQPRPQASPSTPTHHGPPVPARHHPSPSHVSPPPASQQQRLSQQGAGDMLNAAASVLAPSSTAARPLSNQPRPAVSSAPLTPDITGDLLFGAPTNQSSMAPMTAYSAGSSQTQPQSQNPPVGLDLLDFSTPFEGSGPSHPESSFTFDDWMESAGQVYTGAQKQKQSTDLAFAIARLGTTQTTVAKHIDKLSVAQVIESLRQGQLQALSHIISYKGKRELIAAAEATSDADIITVAVLYVKDSLTSDPFFRLIKRDSKSANCLMQYLRETNDFAELAVACKHLSGSLEFSITRLMEAFQTPNIMKRMALLRDCAAEAGANDITRHIAEAAMEQRELLERQCKIEEHDSQVAAQGQEEIYVNFPRPNIVNTTLSHTLYYCLFYHFSADKTKLSSPYGFKSYFKVTDSAMAFQQMRVFGRKGQWAQLRDMVEVKGMQGKMMSMLKTMSTDSKPVFRHPLGLKVFVEIIVLQNGPAELVAELSRAIENPETRFRTCIQFAHKLNYRKQLWIICAEALAEQGHKNRLTALRDEVFQTVDVAENEDLFKAFNDALTYVVTNANTFKKATKDVGAAVSQKISKWGWGK